VFVLLGIGAIYMVANTTDMLTAETTLMSASPGIVRWILLAMTAGFAVKMAIVPVHMWLPDAHSEAPATMSALLSGVIISAGAYAILRVSLGTVFPAVVTADSAFAVDFLHGLALFGVVSAFFGAFVALVETDIKRIIAYSSIAHMGYILFGLSLFPTNFALGFTIAMTGTVLHIITHAVSKGLFFLSAGSVMHDTGLRNIDDMGGFAGKMPFTGGSSIVAALSIAGSPPFACFWSELFIFVGALQVIATDGFYTIPTIFMLIATVLSLAYSLRFIWRVFLRPSKTENGSGSAVAPSEDGAEKKGWSVSIYMKVAMGILVFFVILLGVYPDSFINLIHTVAFI
jgi:formate hydrogenlyase subunit 3/multisubunit Na+/H+ antiporter MnhD subunit